MAARCVTSLAAPGSSAALSSSGSSSESTSAVNWAGDTDSRQCPVNRVAICY